ncbi:MAG TPA: inorganic diphosphatase [Fimbriimonadaceae bacterium]|nr:inorganic diphosphatase [Fimbriimonadaceae bacterium]
MPILDVPIGPQAPEIFNVVVEIPKGSTNKYEIDQETGVLKLDRVLYSPLFYPFDYGYIPQTLYLDGDPIDVLLMISHPTYPGTVVEAKAIGVLEMKDEKGPDEKILCVATKDPRFSQRKSLNDLQEHTKKEIIHFFEVYKTLEEKSVEVLGWNEVSLALKLIEQYRTDRGRRVEDK